jgi:hypothetical protein
MLDRMFAAALIAVCFVLACPVAAQAQDGDVLGPARQGQLQCFEPNVAAKTCQSIGGYTFNANGVIDNTADVLIMPQPVIVMRVTAPVTLRGGAICGPLTTADIERATFTIDGAAASAEDTQAIKTALTQQLAPMLNVETCITLTPVDGGFRADSVMAGTPRPELSQRVVWVRPEDGYRVAP